jgi:hypothetical protein
MEKDEMTPAVGSETILSRSLPMDTDKFLRRHRRASLVSMSQGDLKAIIHHGAPRGIETQQR